jgi:hypothetical protein
VTSTSESEMIHKFKRDFFTNNLRHMQLNAQTGRLDVHAQRVMLLHKGAISVPLGKIEGDFTCEGCELTSLQNAPEQVTGSFWCHKNKLTSLQGGPHTVGGNYFCGWNQLSDLQGAPTDFTGLFVAGWQKSPGLTSVQGFPSHARAITLSWQPQLTLLRLIEYAGNLEITETHNHERMYGLMDVLEKYKGKGKSHILLCSNELKKAGFKGNARW